MERLVAALVILSVLAPGLCLECYTCVRQDNNKDKCVKTTIQCEEGEGACYSQIQWRIPPYWTPHGERIHYLNKGCIDVRECRAWQSTQRYKCRRDWYLDWECIECCSGDLCNFYVTLGAPLSHASSSLTIISGLIITTFAYLLRH